jgi:RNA polymerase sigma-70 factor, ECF subfamily
MSAHLKPLSVDLLVVEALPDAERARAPARGARSERLETWFREYAAMLWRLAARLGVPHSNVDDVVQEAFITADRRAADITAGSERRFLISTTLKLCANQRRRREARREQLEQFRQPADETPDAEQLLARKQLRQWLDMALGTLPLEQRTVFVLYELEGFGIEEMAALLEIPPGTVASRLSRARGKFGKSAARLRQSWLEQAPKVRER